MKRLSVLAAALLATAAFAAPPGPAPGPTLKGEVLEVVDVQTYTYMRLKTGQGETWAAVPRSEVKKGQQVVLEDVAVMENFESPTLKRKFDRIAFGQLAATAAPAAAAPSSPHAAIAASPHGASVAQAAAPVKVARASGADAKTVAEVFSGRATLKDKTVTIRGQVVKVNAGILGKNWVHIQDGSGSAASGTHDILVTTADTTAVGEVVNARGTVRTDVNVGPGYAYAVLVDDATLRK